MKRTALLLAVAAVALAGCKPQTPEPTSEVVVEQRPVGRLEPAAEPKPEGTTAELTDDEIETILAAPSDSSREAPAPEPAEPTGVTHTIRKGDTFWSLAKKYLGSGQRWKEIADANPGLVHNKLAVGTKVRIPAQ